jgi:mannose-6-phosphate isomerase-like protein (cupin superfamily)
MKKMNRREVCVTLPALAVLGTGVPQAMALQQKPAVASTPPTPAAGAGTLGPAHAIGYDTMAVRTMANGGESRDIAHGTLATGETVNLHQSMQVVGATPNPLHVIQHTEFILVREGELEFQHEVDGKTMAERVGPGGVFYVAYGTNHTVKNVGSVPARYFVVAIGGDAK